MEDLCRMMKKQKLICTDENNTKLKEAFLECQTLFQNEDTISPNDVRKYLLKCKYRYTEYGNKISLTSTFRYIKTCWTEFCSTMHGNTPDEVLTYLLLLSYFIDSELLLAIGELELKNEDVEEQETIDGNMQVV
jgi:hypothetical protein